MIKLGVPVKCQNGHRATWIMEITGLECHHRGVAKDEDCKCPKFDFGEGWIACGEPFVMDENCD